MLPQLGSSIRAARALALRAFSRLALQLDPDSLYLAKRELAGIVGVSLVMNYFGLALSHGIPSTLYLDMSGTALTAFLLGPWWGAIVGVLTNCFTNWLLHPGAAQDITVFPWVLVNIVGGMFWGCAARIGRFGEVLRKPDHNWRERLILLLAFGVAGAAIMAIPGTILQLNLSDVATFAPDQALASTLSNRSAQIEATILDAVNNLTGQEAAVAGTASFLSVWLTKTIVYVPDKCISVVIALLVMRFWFPIYDSLLFANPGTWNARLGGLPSLMLFGVVYTPVFLYLLKRWGAISKPWTWWMPWGLFIVALVLEVLLRTRLDEWNERRKTRVRYYRLLEQLPEQQSLRAHAKLLAASTKVVFALAMLGLVWMGHGLRGFLISSFHYVTLLYGLLLMFQIVKASVVQNVGSIRLRDSALGSQAPAQMEPVADVRDYLPSDLPI